MALTVYLGGAIDQSKGDPKKLFSDFGQIVVKALGEDVVVFNPCSSFINAHFIRSPRTNNFVFEINQLALSKADLAIFVWSESPSFGVPLEIKHKAELGGDFIVLNASGKIPGIYMHYVINTIGNGVIVDTENELIECLKRYKLKKGDL